MGLTNTFVKNIKHSIGSAVGKYRDGGGMYLLVNASGKYWRMDYRFANKRKTLSLGARALRSRSTNVSLPCL